MEDIVEEAEEINPFPTVNIPVVEALLKEASPPTVKVPLVEILVPIVVLTPDAWVMMKIVANTTAEEKEKSLM